MTKRKIIKIDEEKCNGCGLCALACAEGAIQIINGKAKLVSDIYCDGLGACIGECPVDALTIEEREAAAFDQEATKKHIAQTKTQQLPCGCPGTMVKDIKPKETGTMPNQRQASELRQWPIQLHLIPPHAPYLKEADLVLLADCTAVAYANLHQDFIKNKVIALACPKLDDTSSYLDKLVQILERNNPKSIWVVMMEVPCCGSLAKIIEQALMRSGKNIPLSKIIIGLDGTVKCKE